MSEKKELRGRALSRAMRLAAVATVLLSLVGCVGIPSSDTITVGDAIEEGDAGVEFFPLGPDPGATREEVLRGFVGAASSSADDYGVARQFLARDFSKQWNLRTGVVVRTSTERVAALDDATMEYSIQVAADINAGGTFKQNDTPAPLTLSFGFVQQNGEWRIDSAADGVVLSDVVFQSTFDPHAVYFLDPTATRLVPDLRWFPGGSASLRIVDALLDGPPEWLQGAVRSAFPDGTRLETSTVEVRDGIADVDLTTEALTTSADERHLMQVQLAASFARVANVREVSISVGGTPLPIGEPAASDPVSNPRVDIRAMVELDGKFGYLEGSAASSIAQLGPHIVATSPIDVTVADDLSSAVTRGSGGVWLARSGGAEPLLVDARTDVVPPSLDNYGWIWSASATMPGTIRVINSGAVAYDLPTEFAADSSIVSIDVSRDGARVAVLLQTPTGPRLVVRAISRDATGDQRTQSLRDAILDTYSATGTALDVTWVDELSVATLRREREETAGGDTLGSSEQVENTVVTVHEIGGRRTPLGSVAGATALVGANGELGLRALGSDGAIVERTVSGWSNTGIVVGLIATQR